MSNLSIFFDALLIGLILVRQWRVRPVPLRLRLGVPIFLGLIGIWQLTRYTNHHPLGSGTALWVTVWLALGVGMGALRGLTSHIWRAEGPFRWVVRRATWATMALWGLGIGLHLALVGRAAGSSLLLSIGIGYGVQRAVEQARAGRLRALDPAPVGPGLFGGLRGFTRQGGVGFTVRNPDGSVGFWGFGPSGPSAGGTYDRGGAGAGDSGFPGVIEAESEIMPPHPDE